MLKSAPTAARQSTVAASSSPESPCDRLFVRDTATVTQFKKEQNDSPVKMEFVAYGQEGSERFSLKGVGDDSAEQTARSQNTIVENSLHAAEVQKDDCKGSARWPRFLKTYH